MRRATAIVGVGAILAVAGCGGSGGGLSASDFRAKANAICGAYDKRIRKAVGNLTGSDPKVIAAAFGKVIPIVREGQSKLHTLKPPGDLQADWASWLALGDTQIRIATRMRAAALKGDDSSFNHELQALTGNQKEQGRLANGKLGLTVCGKST